jgi:hypothetical protein
MTPSSTRQGRAARIRARQRVVAAGVAASSPADPRSDRSSQACTARLGAGHYDNRVERPDEPALAALADDVNRRCRAEATETRSRWPHR